MKSLSKISLLANLALAGAVVYLLNHRSQPIPRTAQTSASAPVPTADPQPAAILKPAPFRWSQLESSDYRAYIANLRGIGCPEQTIRNIVTADVDAAFYATQWEQLRKNPATREYLAAQIEELSHQETTQIASLMGYEIPVEKSAETSKEQTDAPPQMPLVFQNVDLAAAGVDSSHSNVIASIRQRFLNEIGSQRDPNDPEYAKRWRDAQAEADSRLEGGIGLRAYQAYEMKARLAALAQAGTSGAGAP